MKLLVPTELVNVKEIQHPQALEATMNAATLAGHRAQVIPMAHKVWVIITHVEPKVREIAAEQLPPGFVVPDNMKVEGEVYPEAPREIEDVPEYGPEEVEQPYTPSDEPGN